jgi:hypothetical protein
MRRIAQRKRFRNDLERQKRRGRSIDELIADVELLAEEGALPAAYLLTSFPANGKAFGNVTSNRTGS